MTNNQYQITNNQNSKLKTDNRLPATDYSYLRATIGSTFVARRAGMKLASNAIVARRIETMTKVTGSVALTPYKKLATSLVAPMAPASPATIPIATGSIPRHKTIIKTARELAPNAMRMP